MTAGVSEQPTSLLPAKKYYNPVAEQRVAQSRCVPTAAVASVAAGGEASCGFRFGSESKKHKHALTWTELTSGQRPTDSALPITQHKHCARLSDRHASGFVLICKRARFLWRTLLQRLRGFLCCVYTITIAANRQTPLAPNRIDFECEKRWR